MEKFAFLTAAFGAMFITAASGLVIVPALRKLHFGQTIKEIGPTWHAGKNGTPTMGGLTFYLGVLLGVVGGYMVLAVSVPQVLGNYFSQQREKSWVACTCQNSCTDSYYGCIFNVASFEWNVDNIGCTASVWRC